MKPIIKLIDISYAYRNNDYVLSHINLVINEGEDIAIIGHNGSGKSTLGKIIISLLKPKVGQLFFNDIEITSKNDEVIRQKTGIVFQNPDNQFIGATVADDIAFGLENRQIPHNQMQSIIEKYAKSTGVYELLDKTPENLSGGQKQKVAIAGILAMLPNVIVFDEALAMLDPESKEEINNLIAAIKKEHPNLTIIRLTHDLDEAINADRLIVLDKGKIVADDQPLKIFKNHDIIDTLGLEVPFIVRLNEALNKAGLVDDQNYSVNQLVDLLCK